MKKALKTAMMTSISEVLETMFFMTIEPSEVAEWADSVEDASEKKHFASRIKFSGPLSGFFVLSIPESILSTMAEMFMGVDAAEVTETHCTGIISEAINMIAGNTFSKLDDQAVFNLDIPSLVDAVALTGATGSPEMENLFFRIETPSGCLGLQACYSI
jgi:CheY-specific phosphatase CheX